MRSRVVSRKELFSAGLCAAEHLKRDQVFPGAAQASFFLMTSLVPFLSLLFALIGLFLPENPREIPLPDGLSEEMGDLLRLFAGEIAEPPGLTLLSFHAVLALWTASRGIASVRDSLCRIYDAPAAENALLGRLRAIPTTLAVMAATAIPTLLVFFGTAFSETGTAGALIRALGTPLTLALLTVDFTVLYCAAGRRSRVLSGRAGQHLPGALFSAGGWLLFSALYSRYIGRFPDGPAIWGGLGAVCLIMLWLYFCVVIVLIGAEINMARGEAKK